MSRRAYQPQQGSVARRVIEFLRANPEESLTAPDVAVKFDAVTESVRTMLRPAVQAGMLVRVEDLPSGDLVYRLGSRVPAIESKPSAGDESTAADPDDKWIGDTMILCALAKSENVNDQEREVLYRWLEASRPPGLVTAIAVAQPMAFDFRAHLARQRLFSEKTFGPGARTRGVIEHIRKELREIEADPADVREWIDVVIFALDGAWRAGHSPDQIIDALVAKQDTNEARTWPDWRTIGADSAIEHDRSADAASGASVPAASAAAEARTLTATVQIDVKETCGAYVTSTRCGVRASSTMSAEQAARGFGRKYFGRGFQDVEQIASKEVGHSVWYVRGEPGMAL